MATEPFTEEDVRSGRVPRGTQARWDEETQLFYPVTVQPRLPGESFTTQDVETGRVPRGTNARWSEDDQLFYPVARPPLPGPEQPIQQGDLPIVPATQRAQPAPEELRIVPPDPQLSRVADRYHQFQQKILNTPRSATDAPAEAPTWRYLTHGFSELGRGIWNKASRINASWDLGTMVEDEVEWRLKNGAYRVGPGEWDARGGYDAYEDGTIDENRMWRNVKWQLTFGLAALNPDVRSRQQELLTHMQEIAPNELPPAQGWINTFAQTLGNAGPVVAQFVLLHKAGATKGLSRRLTAQSGKYSAAAVDAGLNFALIDALDLAGTDPDPMAGFKTGVAFGAATTVGTAVAGGAGRVAGMSAVFTTETALAGGNLKEIVAAGLMTPLAFEAMGRIGHPRARRARAARDLPLRDPSDDVLRVEERVRNEIGRRLGQPVGWDPAKKQFVDPDGKPLPERLVEEVRREVEVADALSLEETQKDVDQKLEEQEARQKSQARPEEELEAPGIPEEPLGVVRFQDAGRRMRGFFRRDFLKMGDLPKEVFEAERLRKGEIRAADTQVDFAIRDFDKAAKKAYGGWRKMTEEQTQLLDGALKGQVGMPEIPEVMRAPVAAFRDQIDALSRKLIDEGVVEGELEATIIANEGFYATRSYRVFDDPDWAKKVPVADRNKAKALLRSEYPEKSEAEILGKLEELLYTNKAADKGPMAVYAGSKLGSKDLSILKHRKDIHPVIRALWGEHEDARVNYARSVSKMSRLTANHQFLNEVRAAGMDSFLFSEPVANERGSFIKPIASEGSKVLEPLNGLYTTPEIDAAFRQAFEARTLPWYLRHYMKVNGLVKAAKTIWSPMTVNRNLLSNLGFAVANGHIRVGTKGTAAGAAAGAVAGHLIAGPPGAAIGTLLGGLTGGRVQRGLSPELAKLGASNSVEFRNEYQKLQRLGVVGAGARAGELQDVIRDATGKDLDSFVDSSAGNLAKRTANRSMKGAVEIYHFGDDVWKIGAFYDEVARYRKAMPDVPIEQIEIDAAERVRNGYPTYDNVPEAVKQLRRFPLVGTFVSFPAEVYRVGYNTIELAAKELADPRLRHIGARRAAGMLAAATGTAAMATASRFLAGVTKDEDEDMRTFMAPWSENSQIVHTGTSEEGNRQFIDISYTDPWAYLKRPVIAMLRGEEWRKSLWEATLEAAEPFVSEEILTQYLLDVSRNTKKNGGQVYNPQDTPFKQGYDSLGHVLKGVAPGFYSSAERIGRGLQGKTSKYGKAYDPKIEALAVFTGHRISELDVNEALSFKVRAYKRGMQDANRIFRTVMNRRGEVSDAELLQAYEAMETSRQRLSAEMSKTLGAATRLGVSQQERWETLAKEKVPIKVRHQLQGESYQPYVPAPKARNERWWRLMELREADGSP